MPRCDGGYDTPVLENVIMWKDEVLLRWMALLLDDGNERSTQNPIKHGDEQSRQKQELGVGGNVEVLGAKDAGGNGDGGRDAAYGWAQRLGLAVHEAFCSARITELFDIIADYPDSAVAVWELKVTKKPLFSSPV